MPASKSTDYYFLSYSTSFVSMQDPTCGFFFGQFNVKWMDSLSIHSSKIRNCIRWPPVKLNQTSSLICYLNHQPPTSLQFFSTALLDHTDSDDNDIHVDSTTTDLTWNANHLPFDLCLVTLSLFTHELHYEVFASTDLLFHTLRMISQPTCHKQIIDTDQSRSTYISE